MNERCPICGHDPAQSRINPQTPQRGTVEIEGAFACTTCGAVLELNAHPSEGLLPAGLSVELAFYGLFWVAAALAMLLSSAVHPLLTVLSVGVAALATLTVRWAYVRSVPLADWARYRVVREKTTTRLGLRAP